MFNIKRIQDEDFDLCKKFLQSVPTIKQIEDDILKEAVVAYDDDEIIGCVSYEIYNNVGLIRYFVFKKILSESLIKQMFETLEEKAFERGIIKLYCMVNNETIKSLFISLDFQETNTEYFYIDELHFSKLDYKDSEMLEKNLVSKNAIM